MHFWVVIWCWMQTNLTQWSGASLPLQVCYNIWELWCIRIYVASELFSCYICFLCWRMFTTSVSHFNFHFHGQFISALLESFPRIYKHKKQIMDFISSPRSISFFGFKNWSILSWLSIFLAAEFFHKVKNCSWYHVSHMYQLLFFFYILCLENINIICSVPLKNLMRFICYIDDHCIFL